MNTQQLSYDVITENLKCIQIKVFNIIVTETCWKPYFCDRYGNVFGYRARDAQVQKKF